MRLRNTTDIPNELVKEIIRFARPAGIANFDVMLRNGNRNRGYAYYHGSGYHATANPFITINVRRDVTVRRRWNKVRGFYNERSKSFPRICRTYQYGQLRGKRYYWANRIEALVYLTAHELRHLWQHKSKRRGMAFGARGIASEIDTESYAIHKLREWRNRLNNAPLADRSTA